MIGSEEITVAAEWMLGDRTEHQGQRFDEWCRAREIDVDALEAFAAEEAETTLLTPKKLGTGELKRALMVLAIQAFITGIEAERRRRDAEALPEGEAGSNG